MWSRKLISNLAAFAGTSSSVMPTAIGGALKDPVSLCSVALQQLDFKRTRTRHHSRFKLDYNVMRERPLGPHKKLAPFVKHDGRVGAVENYRHIIHYPEDGKYTIKKLPITKLSGRDPVTGRRIIGRVGGGSQQKARWIDWRRLPEDWPKDGPDLVEKVISIHYDPMRKPMIALTGYGERLRWQIATEGMEEGDIITTTCKIPTIPVNPVPGNSYPLGALPAGTEVCLVQWYYDSDKVEVFHERESAKIVRKVNNRVIITRQNRREYSLDERCQCVVGRVSIHPLKALEIGSPNRLRWLGMRPSSGLWHRKTGRHGRKIRALPPVEKVEAPEESKDQKLLLTCVTEGTRGRIWQKKKPFPLDRW